MLIKLNEKGPSGGMEIYKKRRAELLNKIKGGVAVLFSHPEQIRNEDVHHHYRQDSAFYYLTGFPESESVAVIDGVSNTFTLFVKKKDPLKELWTGFLYGLEGAQEHFGANKVYPIDELKSVLPDLLKNAEKVFYRMGEFRDNDEVVLSAIRSGVKSRGRTGLGDPDIADVKTLIGEMRLKKGDDEVNNLRRACDISARGHIRAMKASRPGIYEYELEAELLYEFKKGGSPRVGYGAIVASGVNATVLHYTENNCRCDDGEFVLIDAATEYGYLTSDITRTFPVNGKFSAAQKKFYQAVLTVQKNLVAMVKPGIRFHDIHDACTEGLTDAMLDLGLLKGSRKQLIESNEYKKYFPHGTGHWLGMDVHDSGVYRIKGESRLLEPGMCFTIEPGLYVPGDDTTAPSEYRGLGVRIEDDILVTAKGHENLTQAVPKEVDALEEIIGKL